MTSTQGQRVTLNHLDTLQPMSYDPSILIFPAPSNSDSPAIALRKNSLVSTLKHITTSVKNILG